MGRRHKPRPEGRQLDPDLVAPYYRPSTSEAGRDLLVSIQAARERNRPVFDRPARQLLDRDDLDLEDDLDV
jgi:hypothetical protein